MVSNNSNHESLIAAAKQVRCPALRDHEQIIRVIFLSYYFQVSFFPASSAAILDYNIPDLCTQVT